MNDYNTPTGCSLESFQGSDIVPGNVAIYRPGLSKLIQLDADIVQVLANLPDDKIKTKSNDRVPGYIYDILIKERLIVPMQGNTDLYSKPNQTLNGLYIHPHAKAKEEKPRYEKHFNPSDFGFNTDPYEHFIPKGPLEELLKAAMGEGHKGGPEIYMSFGHTSSFKDRPFIFTTRPIGKEYSYLNIFDIYPELREKIRKIFGFDLFRKK